MLGAVLLSLLVGAPAEAGTASADYQQDAFSTTNRHRVENDRVKLRHGACVQRYAVRQARIMAKQERMFHQDLQPILKACHLSRVGENVAYGYTSGVSVVLDGWIPSPGHLANILNPKYRLLGLGARRDDDGTWYVAQVFGTKA